MWRDIFVTIAQLIVSPARGWREVDAEGQNENDFLNRFLHPVFGIIAVASFVGGLWFSQNGNVEIALKNTIISLVGIYGGYFIASYFLNELAPRFGMAKDIFRYRQFVAYSSVMLYVLDIIQNKIIYVSNSDTLTF